MQGDSNKILKAINNTRLETKAVAFTLANGEVF